MIIFLSRIYGAKMDISHVRNSFTYVRTILYSSINNNCKNDNIIAWQKCGV